MTEFYEADIFDIDLVCTHLEEADRDQWETTRQIMWAVLAPNSKRKIQPDDIMQFSWEKPDHGKPVQATTTKEDFEKAFKNYLKK